MDDFSKVAFKVSHYSLIKHARIRRKKEKLENPVETLGLNEVVPTSLSKDRRVSSERQETKADTTTQAAT